jgi:hypothetical protein
MLRDIARIFAALFVLGVIATATAADRDDISNFREYSPQFASSGQPSAKELHEYDISPECDVCDWES